MSSTSLDEMIWLKLSDVALRRKVAELFVEPAIAVIQPILIKGWSVARFYSDGHIRPSTDIDLLFIEGNSAVILSAIQELKSHLPIDAHFGPRHLDKLSFEELFERSYEIELNGVPIRVLGDEDNLRITAVHWLTDGGVNKQKLWDVYYLVKNRRAGFDWERCLESAGPIRRTWVIAAIATARDHLALNVSDLPDEIRRFHLPRWFQRTLKTEWKRGPYPRRILSTVITRPKLLFEQLYRKFPPNKIAASIDTETPIDDSWRVPAQIRSITRKIPPFAWGVVRRLGYGFRGDKE